MLGQNFDGVRVGGGAVVGEQDMAVGAAPEQTRDLVVLCGGGW